LVGAWSAFKLDLSSDVQMSIPSIPKPPGPPPGPPPRPKPPPPPPPLKKRFCDPFGRARSP
jgi:hypothetical protein